MYTVPVRKDDDGQRKNSAGFFRVPHNMWRVKIFNTQSSIHAQIHPPSHTLTLLALERTSKSWRACEGCKKR